MATTPNIIGPNSAYAIAVQGGYTGSRAEWAAEIANAQANASIAQDAADRVEDLAGSLPADFTTFVADLAQAYSSDGVAYAVGDYVNKDGQIYICTSAIASSSGWQTDSSKFTAVTICGELTRAFNLLQIATVAETQSYLNIT